MKPGQSLSERTFSGEMDQYQLVIVLSNSLEVDYPQKRDEKIIYAEVCRALRKRSYVTLLKGGAKELFRVYGELSVGTL